MRLKFRQIYSTQRNCLSEWNSTSFRITKFLTITRNSHSLQRSEDILERHYDNFFFITTTSGKMKYTLTSIIHNHTPGDLAKWNYNINIPNPSQESLNQVYS